jgi:hypothetical protein
MSTFVQKMETEAAMFKKFFLEPGWCILDIEFGTSVQ